MNEAMIVADLCRESLLVQFIDKLVFCGINNKMGFWRRVFWTDESRFALHFNDERLRIRRLQTEKFLEACVADHDRYGGGSIMIWSGMGYDRKTITIHIVGTLTGKRYVDGVLVPTALSFASDLSALPQCNY